MTRDTLLLLQQVLKGITLNVGAPDFETLALGIIQALKELDEEL